MSVCFLYADILLKIQGGKKSMPNSTNVVAYCRVSTNKEDQINSLNAQKTFFDNYAKNNNLNLIKIYADEGITGTSRKKRDSFNEMMKDSEKNVFSTILVKDFSRFARNTVDFLECIRKLKKRNIDVVFINTGMHSLTTDEFTMTILASTAQKESENMSSRIKFGKKISAENGRVPNLCYGYIKKNGNSFDLDINPVEAEIVKEIFDMYVNQGYGSHKISKILNSRGLTSLRNVKWSATAISRILKNKLYAGYVINGKSEVTDLIERVRTKKDESEWIETARPDLQIVPLEMWEKAQNISKLNNTRLKKNLHKKNSSKHLFSTLITCSVCGYSFRQSKRKNKDDTRIIWLCSGRNHHGAKYCNNKTIIPEDELIKNIDSYFLSIISDKQKFIDSIVSKYESRQQKNPMRELSENLEKLQIKKQKQIMMFENSIITIDELKERVKNIDNAIANIRLELDSTENLKSIEERSRKLYNMLSENFSRYVSVANMTNAEIKTLIKFITADENGNIHIEMNY